MSHLGQSRQFAFAQFCAIPEARRFLDRYYPTVPLYGRYDPTQTSIAEPAKVRIAYSRERDDREKAGKSEDDWKCEVVRRIYDTEGFLLTFPAVLPSQFLISHALFPLQCTKNTFVKYPV